MYILRSLQNPKKYIQIGTSLIRIGRGADNTLVIREKSVSRTHATLQVESGGPVLADLNSTRGTYVNGVKVRRQHIKAGDVISFGTVEWKLEESTAARAIPKISGLILSSVSNPRQQFPLTKGQFHIGRGEENQLRIPDKSISREHALIQFENGEFTVLDKNSSSGTFVNHKRIQKAVLKPGDVIAFGEDQWRVMPAGEVQPKRGLARPVRQGMFGQIYIGGYSMRPDPVHGGALQRANGGLADQLQNRQPPVYVRPCHFGAIVNRKDEVKFASASGPNSPLQFYGPHGAGKSTLLCYLAHHPFAVTFPDGIVHLLARGRGVIDLLQNILAAFYDQPAGFVATEAEIHSRLRSKQALILLDDVELNPEETSELLAAAPGCTFILASSKKCLSKNGRIIALEDLESDDAVVLFGKVLGRALNAEELPLVKMICSVLRNNPVRIIQAASHVRGMQLPLGGIAGLLNVAAPLTVLDNLIVQSLSQSERSILSVLAALDGGSLHNRHVASLAGTKNTKRVLEGLMGRGLVKEVDNRYSLAGTFAAHLQEEWDLSDWSLRIMEHFSSWVGRHQEQPEYVLFEIEAILGILSWAVRAGRWQEILQLSRGVENVAMIGKQWSAWQKLLELSLQASQTLGDRAAEAWALHQLGTRAMCLGDSLNARTFLQQAYKLREALGDQVGGEVTRQNLNLLSAALPVPSKPTAPAKPGIRFLRPFLLFGGGLTAIVALALFLINQPPVPVPSTPIPVSTTLPPRVVFTETPRSPEAGSVTVTPSRTPTMMVSPTKTRTSTPTRTRTSTPTGTRTVPPPSFGSPQLSTDQVYYGDAGCGPKNVTISIPAEHPGGILVVDFFHRLHEIGGSRDSGWSGGLSMDAAGGNTYTLSVSGDTLVAGTGFRTDAQVGYQFVIEPRSGDVARSTVYQDLELLRCDISTETYTPSPTPTPTPTTTSPPSVGSIIGGAWFDSFKNGIFDSGERGYPDLRISLGRGACPSIGYDSTTTDVTGAFSFDYLSPGTYCVSVSPDSCYEISTTEMTAALGPGETSALNWFGYVYVCGPPIK